MPVTIKAALADQPTGLFRMGRLRLEDPAEGEVHVDIDACGICHTDLAARGFLDLPAVLGHEGAGRVRQWGPGVLGPPPGTRVILSYPFCGGCGACRGGTPFHCHEILPLKFAGKRRNGKPGFTPPVTGGFFQQSAFATTAMTLAQCLVPVPADADPVICAALPCGVMTGAGAVLNALNVRPHERLLVLGAGAVGLAAVMAAQLAGVGHIAVIDRVASRLRLAKRLGAHETAGAGKPMPAADVILDTTGVTALLKTALAGLAMGGRAGIVTAGAVGPQDADILDQLFMRAASLHSIFVGQAISATFLPWLIGQWAAGRFPVDRLVTAYPLDRINDAVMDMMSGKAIKPVLLCR